jgi:hypothetical protein
MYRKKAKIFFALALCLLGVHGTKLKDKAYNYLKSVRPLLA